MKFYFPFGQELKKVEQKDKSPKKVFVLGVYASAVHACWVDPNGKQKVAALAVASEPEIFWRGENAEEIIERIEIPKDLGYLVPPKNESLNGPSGKVLDEKYLAPLNCSRNEAWLCDLLPYSRMNPIQEAALKTHYTKEIIKKYSLKNSTIPRFDVNELRKYLNSGRIEEILAEVWQSNSDTLILLGDLPIKLFLRKFHSRHSCLDDFVKFSEYGKFHDIRIGDKNFNVLPLCHPRQAAKLGSSNKKWFNYHKKWMENQ